MHETTDTIAVFLLGNQQPGVAARHAQRQRGLHVLGDIDGDDRRRRRHHLAGLLLVEVKDAREHAGLALVDLAALVRLCDQALELVRGAAAAVLAHVHAQEPQDAICNGRQSDDERMEKRAERLQRPGDSPGDGLGSIDGIELGHHLPRDQLRGGDDREGDDHSHRDRHAMANRVAEGALEDRRERGLAESSNANRGHRHADLYGGDVLVDIVQLCQRERSALRPFLAQQFQTRLARAHERVLGDHEEGVDGDQKRREDELQAVHALPTIPDTHQQPMSPGQRYATATYMAPRRRATSGKIFFVVVHRSGRPAKGSKGDGRKRAPAGWRELPAEYSRLAGGHLYTRPSIWAASWKSASVRPPWECVESVRRTLFQPCTRMSG